MLDAIRNRSRRAVQFDEPLCSLAEHQFARAALKRHAQSVKSDRSNLLTLIVGPAGSGKSRLIHQTIQEALKQKPRLKYLILDSADWDLTPAPDEAAAWEAWTAACSQFELIVCENLDSVIKNPDTSDRIARWLDCLLQGQTSVIVTSTHPTASWTHLTPRLSSRLRGGLLARISELSSASRRQLLSWSTSLADLSLTEPVLEWFCEQHHGSLRHLRQCVERLIVEFPPPARVSDVEAVRRIVMAPAQTRLSLAVIAHQVAEEFGVTIQELRASSRSQTVRLPRQCAMHLAHGVGGWSMAEIGRFFGRRTHNSVSYSCRRFQESIESVPALRTQLRRLEHQLKEQVLKDCG